MCMFEQKQYPENFTFLILKICNLIACEVCKFQQTFHMSHVRISQKVIGVLMWNLNILLSYEDEGISRFSNLRQCTFKYDKRIVKSFFMYKLKE